MEGLDNIEIGFGESPLVANKGGSNDGAPIGLPKHTMLLAVVLAAILNFSEIIVNELENPYNLVEEMVNAGTAFNATCAVFGLAAGLYGALKRNRSAIIFSFVFSCTTAAALRFDERRVAAPHEAFRICVVLSNLLSAWCSMITSEQVQREAVAEGNKTTFLFSADVLDKYIVPALALVQLGCGIGGLVASRTSIYQFEANVLAPKDETDVKLKEIILTGTSILFGWNIVTAIFGFLSITTVGDKFGRGMLIMVASSALTGISMGFQCLRYFPASIQLLIIGCDCPVLGQSAGYDNCSEKQGFALLMGIMYLSWLCNAAQAWSAWALSETREEQGGAGGLRKGGDQSMSGAANVYHRWNVRVAIMQFALATTAFYRYLSLIRNNDAFPDTINMAMQGTTADGDIGDIDWTKGLIEYRFTSLITALTSASCCIFVFNGQKGKYRDMLLTAGALMAFLCTTVALNNVLYTAAESKYGLTIVQHAQPRFDLRNHSLTAEECAKTDLEMYPTYASLEPLLPANIANDDLKAVYELSTIGKSRWALYCQDGYAAWEASTEALLEDQIDMAAVLAAVSQLSAAAVRCHGESFGIEAASGFGDGKGFYDAPVYTDYPEGAEDVYGASLVLQCAVLGVAIVQQFVTLAMSEANE